MSISMERSAIKNTLEDFMAQMYISMIMNWPLRSSHLTFLFPPTFSFPTGERDSPFGGYGSKCDDYWWHWEHGNVCWRRCMSHHWNSPCGWSNRQTCERSSASDRSKVCCREIWMRASNRSKSAYFGIR